MTPIKIGLEYLAGNRHITRNPGERSSFGIGYEMA